MSISTQSIERPTWSLLLPIALGIAAFFLVVGIDPLIPTNIAWLSGQDPSQHYLGWAFFRYSPWTNPLGLNPNYGLEISNAIAFSDSIPWLAFIFKPFSIFLPEPFQYLGLWVLLCFILQAWFSWKLAGLMTQDLLLRLFICGLLGVFAPPFLKRLGLHAALMGQFLILAALYFNLNNQINHQNREKTNRTNAWSWLALLALAALTNIYLLVMVFGLWFAYTCDGLLSRQLTFKTVVIQILLIGSALGLCLWQTGYFVSSGAPIQAEGFGQYKINLLSLLDAGRYSYFLKPIPHPEDLEEGFVFLGAGLIGLLITYLFLRLLSSKANDLVSQQNHNGHPRTVLIGPGLFASLICFTVFSFSNQISLGPWTWTYPLPESLLQIAGILRSSGRFFWPVYYVLVFALLRWVVLRFSIRQAQTILAIALAVQVIDTSAGWLPLRKTFAQLSEQSTKPALAGPFWDGAAKRYTKVLLWPLRVNQTQEHWQELAYFASAHQMGTNAVYLGRRADPLKVEQFNQNVQNQFQEGILSHDALYIISDTPEMRQWLSMQILPANTYLFNAKNLIAIAPSWEKCPRYLPKFSQSPANR